MSYNALVLLGYSGVGKDTIANLLITDDKRKVNVKFSALTKRLIERAFDYPTGALEDKQQRVEPLELNRELYELNAMDLLTALFTSGNSRVEQAGLTYALRSIKPGQFPVFTDVRRRQEAYAIAYNFNPLVLYLVRDDIFPSVNDSGIHFIYDCFAKSSIHATINLVKDKPELTVETIKLLLGNQ